jgi:hypothetical protein
VWLIAPGVDLLATNICRRHSGQRGGGKRAAWNVRCALIGRFGVKLNVFQFKRADLGPTLENRRSPRYWVLCRKTNAREGAMFGSSVFARSARGSISIISAASDLAFSTSSALRGLVRLTLEALCEENDGVQLRWRFVYRDNLRLLQFFSEVVGWKLPNQHFQSVLDCSWSETAGSILYILALRHDKPPGETGFLHFCPPDHCDEHDGPLGLIDEPGSYGPR